MIFIVLLAITNGNVNKLGNRFTDLFNLFEAISK